MKLQTVNCESRKWEEHGRARLEVVGERRPSSACAEVVHLNLKQDCGCAMSVEMTRAEATALRDQLNDELR